MSQADEEVEGRRWFQFSLRSLLMAAALVALAALAWRWYVAPYQRQRQTMALVESLGGSCQTAQAAAWLRRVYGSDFQNLVLVYLADCDDPAKYLDHVAALPALETLVVGGPAFTDDHLRRLHRLTTLRGLVLDSTNVTDAGLAALRDALPHVDVYQSQRRAIVALNRHDIDRRLTPFHTQLRELVGDDWFFQEAHAFAFDASENMSDADLANLKTLSQLQFLWLSGARVSDAGLINLKGLKQLVWLDLRDTHVSDAGLVHLKALARLETLYVGNTKVTAAGVADLRRALPTCRVYAEAQ